MKIYPMGAESFLCRWTDMRKSAIAFYRFANVHKNWNANYIRDTGTCQITRNTALVQDQHRLVYMM